MRQELSKYRGTEHLAKESKRKPNVSVVVVVYNMAREAPRTLHSLSAAYQRHIDPDDYEVIVVDNGSTPPFDPHVFETLKGYFRLIRIDRALPSPAAAINRGLAEARGKLIGVMIDGARIASPGIVGLAAMADKLADRTVILTLGFHLGSEVQMSSVMKGYNQQQEDLLLTQANWMEDGYRLFDISVFAGSSNNGWFGTIGESNAIFMRRELWQELGGFDRRFQTPGGGLVNLDTLARAVALPDVTVTTLLGEGTFHQVHGGVATNAIHSVQDAFHAEYMNIRGRPFQAPIYQSLYFGSAPFNGLASFGDSVKGKLLPEQSQRATFHLERAKASRMQGNTRSAALEYRTALTFDDDLVEAYTGLSELRMPGEGYLSWLARLQAALSPKLYLEIGVGSGQSLALARPPTRAIGVDPQPKINVPFNTEIQIFSETSNEFFARGKMASFLAHQPLSLAFIDGLHVFAQSLRDFINVETFCGPRSVVLIHDTVPWDEVTQRPERQRTFYTGDVWKTVLCLKHYRPDLDIFTIATPLSGLTVITGLNPSSRILVDRYQEAIERFDVVRYADIENCIDESLNLVANSWDIAAAHFEKHGIF
jgi:hypothetical protein